MAIDIETFYTQYGPMVLRRCRFLLKNEERALDAMQEVFVNLLKNKETLAGTYPSSLLFRIATNVCLNMIRSSHRRPEHADEEMLSTIAAFDDSEKRLVLSDLLDTLFAREKTSTRTILTLLYVDDMTLEETAHAVNLSVSGVRKRVRDFKARAHALNSSAINWREFDPS